MHRSDTAKLPKYCAFVMQDSGWCCFVEASHDKGGKELPREQNSQLQPWHCHARMPLFVHAGEYSGVLSPHHGTTQQSSDPGAGNERTGRDHAAANVVVLGQQQHEQDPQRAQQAVALEAQLPVHQGKHETNLMLGSANSTSCRSRFTL